MKVPRLSPLLKRSYYLRLCLGWALRRRAAFRSPARRLLRRLRLENAILESQIARRFLLTPDEPRYRRILESRPCPTARSAHMRLHMLLCERDLLRGVWALKSFFVNSGFDASLTIHNDGSLTPDSIDTLRRHFPDAEITAFEPEKVDERLAEFPNCRLFRRMHPMSRKLIDIQLAPAGSYAIIQDSDILWFQPARRLGECVAADTPFYVLSSEAYARTREFMEIQCGFTVGRGVNAGLIGYRPGGAFRLERIEQILERLIHVPPELDRSSLGHANKNGKLNWWRMEQTVYAVLFGDDARSVPLEQLPAEGGAHTYANYPISPATATQHFISDKRWNAMFPVGVEHLLRTGFLDKLNRRD